MKRIKNLYVGDIYSRRWVEDEKANPSDYGFMAHGIIELMRIERNAFLYKTKDNKYVIADVIINEPFSNLKLYLLSLNEVNKMNSFTLTGVSKKTKKYGIYGTLGIFVDEKSIKKVM